MDFYLKQPQNYHFFMRKTSNISDKGCNISDFGLKYRYISTTLFPPDHRQAYIDPE